MSDVVAGVLHPGEMGVAVGRCLAAAGHIVLWASEGRGPATAARAGAAGFRDVGGPWAMARQAAVILSICPPSAAVDVARSVAGFRGVFVDGNAVSPGTAREVARVIEASGGSYVDGGIIGPPPGAPPPGALPPGARGSTRLYLSGRRADEVRDLFAGTVLATPVLDGGNLDGGSTAASALKMAYAGWTKGTAALVLVVRALARATGIEGELLAEWALSQPGLAKRSEAAAGSAASKGWRWVAEMEEIAATMDGAHLPGGFHRAAAEIFSRTSETSQEAGGEAGVEQILTALLGT